MWSAQPSILTVVDDYFKTNPGVKDLPWLGIEPQFPSLQPVVVVMSYNNPMMSTFHIQRIMKVFFWLPKNQGSYERFWPNSQYLEETSTRATPLDAEEELASCKLTQKVKPQVDQEIKSWS